MKFETPTIPKPEEAAQETTAVETKEQKETRTELLLDELRTLIERTDRASRDEPIEARNARFGLMMSNIREIRQLLKETKETS